MYSKIYEKKYKKYKSRYIILKSKLGTLNGGECISLPNPEEEDFLAQNLLDLCPDERITIQNKCYDIRNLYELVIKRGNLILPGTITRITEAEKEKLKKEYKLLLQAYKKNKFGKYLSFLQFKQLPVYVILDRSHLRPEKYEEEIETKYNIEGLNILEIPLCVTENIYTELIAQRRRIIKISGFGNRPDIDNMFLTVSDPGTGRYNIDIWKVNLITKSLENKFHLNIGNWNVVRRNEYLLFASNINIVLYRNYDNLLDSPNLTFDSALWRGIIITVRSFVDGRNYDTDCDTFSFDLKYRRVKYEKDYKICYNRLQFHNNKSEHPYYNYSSDYESDYE
jgi:hypothetical protein